VKEQKVNRTLELIQLEQAQMCAAETAAMLEAKAQHEACAKAFEPIKAMLEDVKDISIMHHGGNGMIPLKDDVRDSTSRSHIEFWDSYGRGFEVGCIWGNCGPEYFVVEPGGKRKTVDLHQAQKAFVKYLASRMPKPGVKK
jgi:hypothetical protein